MKTVAQKMGLQAGMRAIFVDASEDAVAAIAAPELDLAKTLAGEFDYIHLFVRDRAAMESHFPRLRAHLAPAGKLWVSWPKGRQLGTDLTLPAVIAVGYEHGLVESTTLSVDATWSAIKFTWPRPGKQYNNSFGTLGERR